MQKILFNDKFGLTQAVLEGRKTMTRRIMPEGTPIGNFEDTMKHSRYKVGEVVAVAQPYKECGYEPEMLQQVYVPKPTIFPELDQYSPLCGWVDLPLKYHKGWNNKMFVLAGLLPHQIRITSVRIERLQDISDEDCLREGIYDWRTQPDYPNGAEYSSAILYGYPKSWDGFSTPREAFAALIDKISGKGTFASNPWVFVYTFELVK